MQKDKNFCSFLSAVIFLPMVASGVSNSSVNTASQAVLIEGVPAYTTGYASGPAVGMMLLGYYALHGFPDLLPGDPTQQTDAINALIVSPEHLRDYAYPKDNPGNITPDLSMNFVPPYPHDWNSLADFMQTSQSAASNPFGYTHPGDFFDGIGAFAAWRQVPLPAALNNVTQMGMEGITAGEATRIKSEIDAKRPVVGARSIYQNGTLNYGENSYLLIVGYDASTDPMQLAVLDPLQGQTIQWLPFIPYQSGKLSWVYLAYGWDGVSS